MSNGMENVREQSRCRGKGLFQIVTSRKPIQFNNLSIGTLPILVLARRLQGAIYTIVSQHLHIDLYRL